MVASLVGESAMSNIKYKDLFGLLIIFRLWRIVRIIHITSEANELKEESHKHLIEKKIEKLKKNLLIFKKFCDLDKVKKHIDQDLWIFIDSLEENNEE